mmetsp:Transcript_19835/g.27531  ORF Transcript_19835/g.27531 Transcript_19835/m.27531 type:complete len:201 (+) Transcript_19835:139-741(+)
MTTISKKNTVAPHPSYSTQQHRRAPQSQVGDVFQTMERYKGKFFNLVNRKLTEGISRSDIAVVVRVKLERTKDRINPARVHLADACALSIKRTLQRQGYYVCDSFASMYVLEVIVVLASDGSRCGRFWAAEFGVGLAKIGVLYILHTRDASNVIKAGRRGSTSSLACGFADLCDRDAGVYHVVNRMASEVAYKVDATVSR